jgi:hypothetical protein
LIDGAGGHYPVMTETADKPSIELDEPPNLPPGPTEQGGHGGMATREQEARIYQQQKDTEALD